MAPGVGQLSAGVREASQGTEHLPSPRCPGLPVSPPQGEPRPLDSLAAFVSHTFCSCASTVPPGLAPFRQTSTDHGDLGSGQFSQTDPPLAPPLLRLPREEHTCSEIHQAGASGDRALWRALVWSEGKRRVLEENYRVRRGWVLPSNSGEGREPPFNSLIRNNKYYPTNSHCAKQRTCKVFREVKVTGGDQSGDSQTHAGGVAPGTYDVL